MESSSIPGSGGCPPDETLAALLDGRGRRHERRELMAHLDECARCRAILAYSGEYRARSGAGAASDPSRSWKAFFWAPPVRYAAAAALALAALSAGLAARSALQRGAATGALSTDRFVASLRSDSGPTLRVEERWEQHNNSFLFASGSTPAQRAFRIGVALIDLRVELQKGESGDAPGALQALRSLSRTRDGELFAARWSSLEEVLSHDADGSLPNELERLDDALLAALDPLTFDFGRWTEAGRLAAGRGDLRFFRDQVFEDVLSELARKELGEPVRREIAAIRALTSPVSEDHLEELEARFLQLILLH